MHGHMHCDAVNAFVYYKNLGFTMGSFHFLDLSFHSAESLCVLTDIKE